MCIPRYGSVRAIRPFTVIAAQNPYDDVGTVRVSRAFMDRICLIKMGYQSEEEERDIVRLRTGQEDEEAIALTVSMVRRTREHPDIKLGASVRAAIDLVDIYAGLQKLEDEPNRNFLLAAGMAMANKIWLKEMTSESADEIIKYIFETLRTQYDTFMTNKSGKGESSVPSGNALSEEETAAQKKKGSVRRR